MADRRNRAWVDEIVNENLSTAVLAKDLLVDAGAPLSDTITIARLVIDMVIVPESVELNVSSVQRIDIGIGVSSTAAFAVAAGGGLPDPRLVAEVPPRGWLWKTSQVFVYSNSATFGIETYLYPRVKADLGAMRKLDKGTLFMVMAKTTLSHTASDLDISGSIRVLCLT